MAFVHWWRQYNSETLFRYLSLFWGKTVPHDYCISRKLLLQVNTEQLLNFVWKYILLFSLAANVNTSPPSPLKHFKRIQWRSYFRCFTFSKLTIKNCTQSLWFGSKSPIMKYTNKWCKQTSKQTKGQMMQLQFLMTESGSIHKESQVVNLT